jgi:spore germination protein KA
MVSASVITELIFEPVTDIPPKKDSHELFHFISENLLLSTDRPTVQDYDTLFRLIHSGFAVLIAENIGYGLGFGVQGYSARSVQEPLGESNVMGAHEGFTETIRTNMSQIRRRLKTPELVMELSFIGKQSHTDICICYMKDRVPKKLMDRIRSSIERNDLEAVLTTGYLRPFLEDGRFEIFNTTGTTERPDVLCSKLIEGRTAVLVDGIPYAIVIPRLFCESFQTLDDYAYKPYYAVFIRWLKYELESFPSLSIRVFRCLYGTERENSRPSMIMCSSASVKSCS